MKKRIREILMSRERRRIEDARLTQAAVLVPLYEKDGELYLLLTKRTETLPLHRGEVSFPGGRCQASDRSPLETALREAYEEVGVRSEDVEVLGELDDVATFSSAFAVTPFVGFIPYPYPFQVNPAEIQELIPLPLSALKGPAIFREEVRQRADGQEAPVYFYDYGPHTIWGLTARILKGFLELLYSSSGREGERQEIP